MRHRHSEGVKRLWESICIYPFRLPHLFKARNDNKITKCPRHNLKLRFYASLSFQGAGRRRNQQTVINLDCHAMHAKTILVSFRGSVTTVGIYAIPPQYHAVTVHALKEQIILPYTQSNKKGANLSLLVLFKTLCTDSDNSYRSGNQVGDSFKASRWHTLKFA